MNAADVKAGDDVTVAGRSGVWQVWAQAPADGAWWCVPAAGGRAIEVAAADLTPVPDNQLDLF